MSAQTQGQIKTAGGGVNNPMNIRVNAANNWKGKITPAGQRFEWFDSMADGYRAGMKILRTLYNSGLTSLSVIIHAYAPEQDGNAPDVYTNDVATEAGIDPQADLKSVLWGDQIGQVVTAMTRVEQGNSFQVNQADVDLAYQTI